MALLNLFKPFRIFLFATLLFFFFPQSANAQLKSMPKTENAFIKAIQSPEQNLESFVSGKLYPGGPSGLVPILLKTMTIYTIGAYDENGDRIASGAIQPIEQALNLAYQTTPVSSIDYLAHTLKEINPVPAAYARSANQGSDLFTPLFHFWQTSRNIAYIFFIIIFVVIGFMIMFRAKLNPQTVINLQLALPKIVVSLILVTFSFAISGLIVDFAFLGNKLIFYFLTTSNSAAGTGILIDQVTDIDIIGFLLSSAGSGWGGVGVLDILASMVAGLSSFLASGFSDLTVLFTTILAFTLFGTAIKIFFSLFTKYVTLILQAVFSPFVFLFSSLPNGGKTISGYFKSMLSAALCFPATYLLFILSSYIVQTAIDPAFALFDLPPLNTENSLGSTTTLGLIHNGLGLFTGLGILMIIPSVPQAIDKALNVGPSVTSGAADFGGALRKIPIIGGLLG